MKLGDCTPDKQMEQFVSDDFPFQFKVIFQVPAVSFWAEYIIVIDYIFCNFVYYNPPGPK